MPSREDWDFYLTRLGERPVAVFCDLAAETDPARPVRLRVRVDLLAPRPEDGLATADECPALNELEDALVAAADALGARYVGRWTCAGFREFVFYAPRAGAAAARIADVAAAFPDYEVATTLAEDPEWAMFRDLLLPGPAELRWILDRRLVTRLREAGDAPGLPRPVAHYVEFDDPGRREAFLEAARARGFAAEATPDGAGVRLVREDPVDLEHIHGVALGLVDLAEAHGGDYDGWGAPVVRTIG